MMCKCACFLSQDFLGAVQLWAVKGHFGMMKQEVVIMVSVRLCAKSLDRYFYV